MKSWLVIAIAVLLAAAPLSAQSSTPTSAWPHRGFSCDFSAIAGTDLVAEVDAAVREQIDIVCAVGLPPRILDFFRTLPLKVIAQRTGSPGRYNNEKQVELSLTIVAFHNRPVLLHELLHALHVELKDGVRNAEIQSYYQRARQKDVYSSKSHMMGNVQEFFACSGTTFLAGHTGQEPFLREKLRTSQPRFYDHLKTLFGPDAGTYEGSRKGPDLARLQQLRQSAVARTSSSESQSTRAFTSQRPDGKSPP